MSLQDDEITPLKISLMNHLDQLSQKRHELVKENIDVIAPILSKLMYELTINHYINPFLERATSDHRFYQRHAPHLNLYFCLKTVEEKKFLRVISIGVVERKL